jgi:hypothetical protein
MLASFLSEADSSEPKWLKIKIIPASNRTARVIVSSKEMTAVAFIIPVKPLGYPGEVSSFGATFFGERRRPRR